MGMAGFVALGNIDRLDREINRINRQAVEWHNELLGVIDRTNSRVIDSVNDVLQNVRKPRDGDDFNDVIERNNSSSEKSYTFYTNAVSEIAKTKKIFDHPNHINENEILQSSIDSIMKNRLTIIPVPSDMSSMPTIESKLTHITDDIILRMNHTTVERHLDAAIMLRLSQEAHRHIEKINSKIGNIGDASKASVSALMNCAERQAELTRALESRVAHTTATANTANESVIALQAEHTLSQADLQARLIQQLNPVQEELGGRLARLIGLGSNKPHESDFKSASIEALRTIDCRDDASRLAQPSHQAIIDHQSKMFVTLLDAQDKEFTRLAQENFTLKEVNGGLSERLDSATKRLEILERQYHRLASGTHDVSVSEHASAQEPSASSSSRRTGEQRLRHARTSGALRAQAQSAVSDGTTLTTIGKPEQSQSTSLRTMAAFGAETKSHDASLSGDEGITIGKPGKLKIPGAFEGF
jgi:hypothetical protein